MPYITKEARQEVIFRTPLTAGELNYLLTKLCHEYIDQGIECYQSYNDVMGALTNCQHELYRRYIVPFEDRAIERNGDV